LKHALIAGLGLLLATAGAAGAQERYSYASPASPSPGPGHGCHEAPHTPGDDCVCDREVTFYVQPGGWNDIRVRAPGVRVYGRPITIASGRVDIQGPPVYVEAPPIRIAAPQIYLHRPEVIVRPSNVTVEPPQIHFTGCDDGGACAPSGSPPASPPGMGRPPK